MLDSRNGSVRRRLRLARVLLSLLVTAILANLTIAKPYQQTPSVGSVPAVSLLFSLADKAGNPPKGLKPPDIKIFEDGKPQKVMNLVEATDLPLSIVLLVDMSGSNNSGMFKNLLSRTLGFFQANLRKSQDKVALFTFGRVMQMNQNFTDDPAVLASAINRSIGPVYGPTSLNDVLRDVSRILAKEPGRKLIFLVTDGEDNNSKSTSAEATADLQKNNISVFSFYTPSVSSIPPTTHHDSLERLSVETGGTFSEGKGWDSEFSRIRSVLMSQYAVTYIPENTKSTGRFHPIRIQTTLKDFKITARSAYYR